ncbi:hypothetical protein ABIF63_005760 [Bradyrhizobium japonicum]|uniref:Uncharacterized protein n=1 Tax=Bradyrhizobium japonicum TaxID=375 RepID=A0ABV2RXN1_BRAJP|nr:hypothetical protein [Bradyrhizobium japonicum]UQD95251.1 hypothetical protein JEY30_26905 [Bradyrhizobium japonicum]WLB23438.1 hypothetical protein QIH95_22360 [Bradyrhizobium japonicum]
MAEEPSAVIQVQTLEIVAMMIAMVAVITTIASQTTFALARIGTCVAIYAVDKLLGSRPSRSSQLNL